MSNQRVEYSRGMVLDAVARLLPFGGRDFDVEVAASVTEGFGPSAGRLPVSIKFVPKTAMGQAIMPVIEQQLPVMLEVVERERNRNGDEQFPDDGASDSARVAEEPDSDLDEEPVRSSSTRRSGDDDPEHSVHAGPGDQRHEPMGADAGSEVITVY